MINQECIVPVVTLDFIITMLKSSLCDYSDTYKLVEGTIIITGAGANAVERKQMKEKNV